jgi:hypothetical protein
MHIIHQKFSPNHIQAHTSLNITQMYNNIIITEVHTSNIDQGSARNGYERYVVCLVTHRPNCIGQHYQPCGHGVGDTCLWVI